MPPKIWKIEKVKVESSNGGHACDLVVGNPDVDALLAGGWEPFAVSVCPETAGRNSRMCVTVWFRKE